MSRAQESGSMPLERRIVSTLFEVDIIRQRDNEKDRGG
jgi:hypothetical protein